MENDTQAKIIEAAFNIFGRNGFEGTSIKLIAQEAGIAPGSIYNYFPDKEALFKHVVQAGWDQFQIEFEKIIASQDQAEKKFENTMMMCFNLLKTAHPLLKGMLFDSGERNLLQQNIDRFIDRWETLFAQSITASKKENQMPTNKRLILIKYCVSGILLTLSLSTIEDVEKELTAIKKDIQVLLE